MTECKIVPATDPKALDAAVLHICSFARACAHHPAHPPVCSQRLSLVPAPSRTQALFQAAATPDDDDDDDDDVIPMMVLDDGMR